MQKNKLSWIAIPVVIIIVGVYFAWSKNLIPNFGKQNNSQTKNGNQELSQDNQNQSASSDSSSSVSQDNIDAGQNSSDVSPDEKRSDEKPDENLRQQIMAYANQNLNKLATPPANDKWDVPTYYFVGNSNVYVELYAVDTDLAGAKMLYKAEKDGSSGIKLSEVARYKEGEDDWILSSGQDNFDNYVMEEYDYNDKTKKWEKTDEFTDETATNDNTDTGSGSASGQVLN